MEDDAEPRPTPQPSDSPATRHLPLVAALVVVGACIGLYVSGALDGISDPDRIRTLVDDAGVWGPLVFFAVALALFPVMLFAPAVWASMLLWPWPVALLICYTAAIVPSVVTYALARAGGRNARRMPQRLKRYRDALLARPTATVLTLRLVLWANPLADVLIATSGVALRPYLIGTFVGMLPPTIFHLFLGAGLQHLDAVPTEVYLVVAAVAVVAAATWAVRRSRPRSLG